jgi:hypothetical protein
VLAAEPPAGCIRQDEVQVRYLLKPFAVPALLDHVRAALEVSPTGKRFVAQDA